MLILKENKISTSKNIHKLEAVPWIFKDYLKIKYDPEYNYYKPKIKFNKILKDKLLKYNTKISSITDPNSQLKIHYFNKLISWHTKITNYKNRSIIHYATYLDNYFETYNQRLEKLIK